MYNENGVGAVAGGGAGAAGALAFTGLNILALTLGAVVLILAGVVLARRMAVRLDDAAAGAEVASDAAHSPGSRS